MSPFSDLDHVGPGLYELLYIIDRERRRKHSPHALALGGELPDGDLVLSLKYYVPAHPVDYHYRVDRQVALGHLVLQYVAAIFS